MVQVVLWMLIIHGFSEYLSSKLWNPYRKGLEIVSRGAGDTYVNFEGKTITSKGPGGRPLEYKRFKQAKGGWIEIRPIAPSHAYETAMQWMIIDWLPTAVKNSIKRKHM